MAAERCWNCDGELIQGNRFCTACGSLVPGPEEPAAGYRVGAGPARGPGATAGLASKPSRYYAPRYLGDPAVYVQEAGYWRSFGPQGASGGANGEIPAPISSQLVEIDPIQGRRMVAARIHEVMGGTRALVEYAGFWRRVAAALIDYVALQLVTGALSFGTIGFDFAPGGVAAAVSGVTGVATLIAVWLYHALMESSSLQATLGKMALGIVVTDLDGGRISFGRATARWWSQILSALIFGVGYLMAGFTERKQALHDMIAHTLVVLKDPYR
jgi:uncharacterized RDD family membrane protein YckC